MARRKKDPDVTYYMVLMILAPIFIIKWLIEALSEIGNAINSFSRWIDEKKKRNEIKSRNKRIKELQTIRNNYIHEQEQIYEHAFSDLKRLNPIKYDYDVFVQELGLVDKKVYDEYFLPQIRVRGQKYYRDNKVKIIASDDATYKGIVYGTDTYNVSLTFDKNNLIKEASCTCPYFVDSGKYCKHLYALLLDAKFTDNSDKVFNRASKFINDYIDYINYVQDYIDMHKTKLNISNELVTQFTDYIIQYKKEAKDYYKKLTDYNDKNYTLTLLSIFRDAVNSQNRFIDKVNRFIEKYSVEALERLKRLNLDNNEVSYVDSYNPPPSINRSPANSKSSGNLGILAGLLLDNNDDSNDVDEDLEREMKMYNLDDWQKEEVRKGHYSPYNFEEDDSDDEDDYYSEDDE